jgi:hypothetical protein
VTSFLDGRGGEGEGRCSSAPLLSSPAGAVPSGRRLLLLGLLWLVGGARVLGRSGCCGGRCSSQELSSVACSDVASSPRPGPMGVGHPSFASTTCWLSACQAPQVARFPAVAWWPAKFDALGSLVEAGGPDRFLQFCWGPFLLFYGPGCNPPFLEGSVCNCTEVINVLD